MTSKTLYCRVKFTFDKQIEENLWSSIIVLCLSLLKQVFTKMMFCLIIPSNQDLSLFWGYVQMCSGWHVVIDFLVLGLKSDCKERGDSGELI